MRLYICALFLLLAAYTCFAAPAPKDSWKQHGWERPINPDKDCKIDIKNDGTVTMELPGGDHEFAPKRNRFNAPRLLREIEGDFRVQVRVCASFRPSAESVVKREDLEFPNHPSVAAGLVLIPADKNCIRLEYKAYISRGKQSNVPAFLTRRKQFGNIYEELSWKPQIGKGNEERIYLRLERRGRTIYRLISPDGEMWEGEHVLTQLSPLPATLKVGLAAYSTSTEPFKVRFDQFKLFREQKKSK